MQTISHVTSRHMQLSTCYSVLRKQAASTASETFTRSYLSVVLNTSICFIYIGWRKSQLLIRNSRPSRFIFKKKLRTQTRRAAKSEYSSIFQDQMLRLCISVADIVDILSYSTIWTHAPSHNTQHTVLAWRGYASGTSQADFFPQLFCSVSTGAKCASSDNDRVALGFRHASFPTAPFWKKNQQQKTKKKESSTQINIAVPLVHADDVITQFCLLGRLCVLPWGILGHRNQSNTFPK